MKKVIGIIMMVIMTMTAAIAAAEVTVNWDVKVTGIEVTDGETEFKENGWDFEIVVSIDEKMDEVKFEKNVIRFRDDEDCNYNDGYAVQMDEFGLAVDDGFLGHIDPEVAVCRTQNVAAVVEQLVKHLEKEFPESDFEVYVFENK